MPLHFPVPIAIRPRIDITQPIRRFDVLKWPGVALVSRDAVCARLLPAFSSQLKGLLLLHSTLKRIASVAGPFTWPSRGATTDRPRRLPADLRAQWSSASPLQRIDVLKLAGLASTCRLPHHYVPDTKRSKLIAYDGLKAQLQSGSALCQAMR